MLKDTQNSPSLWFNVVQSLENLYQAVVARNDLANLQSTLNKGAGGTSLTIFVADCLQNLKIFEKGFLKTQKFFLKKWPIFKRGLYRHVYYINLGLCSASISKNFTSKKQKNLLYVLKIFWNQAWHGFLCSSYELAIFGKLIFNVLHSQNVRMNT